MGNTSNEFCNRLVEDGHALKVTVRNPWAANFLLWNKVPHSRMRCNYPELFEWEGSCGYYLDDYVSNEHRRVETVEFALRPGLRDPFIRIEKQLKLANPIMGYVVEYGPFYGLKIDLFSMNEGKLTSGSLQRLTRTGSFNLNGSNDLCNLWRIRETELEETASNLIVSQMIRNEVFNFKRNEDRIYAYAM